MDLINDAASAGVTGLRCDSYESEFKLYGKVPKTSSPLPVGKAVLDPEEIEEYVGRVGRPNPEELCVSSLTANSDAEGQTSTLSSKLHSMH